MGGNLWVEICGWKFVGGNLFPQHQINADIRDAIRIINCSQM